MPIAISIHLSCLQPSPTQSRRQLSSDTSNSCPLFSVIVIVIVIHLGIDAARLVISPTTITPLQLATLQPAVTILCRRSVHSYPVEHAVANGVVVLRHFRTCTHAVLEVVGPDGHNVIDVSVSSVGRIHAAVRAESISVGRPHCPVGPVLGAVQCEVGDLSGW